MGRIEADQEGITSDQNLMVDIAFFAAVVLNTADFRALAVVDTVLYQNSVCACGKTEKKKRETAQQRLTIQDALNHQNTSTQKLAENKK